jgi:pyridoxine 4-dehydrogenase
MNASNGNPPASMGVLAGRPVARLGYGAMQLSGPGGLTAPPRQTAISVLRRAAQLGVNHIDTAHFYGAGLANELIRAALSPYPDSLVLVSKLGAEEDAQGKLHPAQRPEQLRAGVEADLRSLGVDRVDVVNLRRLDGPPGIQAVGDQLVDLDSQLAEMAALHDEGKIGGIGLSNVSQEQLRQALPAGIACVQNAYSVLDRSGEGLLALCAEHDIAWVPYFPLGSGFPGRPKVAEHPAVVAAATTLGCTPPQVGLAWLLRHDPRILLIPGTASVAHLEENMAVAHVDLDPVTAANLDTLAPAARLP